MLSFGQVDGQDLAGISLRPKWTPAAWADYCRPLGQVESAYRCLYRIVRPDNGEM